MTCPRCQALPGQSFNLDSHSIPFFGADEFIEKHYVFGRSRRQKRMLAFLSGGSPAPRRNIGKAGADRTTLVETMDKLMTDDGTDELEELR